VKTLTGKTITLEVKRVMARDGIRGGCRVGADVFRVSSASVSVSLESADRQVSCEGERILRC
jgi:hypothetical protein